MSAHLLAKKGVSDAPHPAVSLATHRGSIISFRECIIERTRAALPAHVEQLTSFSSVKICSSISRNCALHPQ